MRTRFARPGLVLAAAVGVVLAGSATAWAVAWDNVKPVVDSGQSTSGLQKLVWSASNLSAVDAAFADGTLSADGSPGLAQVYSHTNQQMYYKTASQCASAKAAVSAADAKYTLAAWCFAGSDETSDAWVPQAVTSSQDAEQYSGYAAGGDEVVGLWRQSASAGNRGRCTSVPDDPARSVNLRATFIQRPYTDGTHSAYRHVLLVAPTTNGNVIAPICDVHGGGAVWYGPYLFVSWHGAGFKVFDTRRTYKIPYDTTCGTGGAAPGVNDIGVVGGRVCAAGYRYVMVQVGQFATTPSGCSTTPSSLNAGLCFSGISLQWSDNSIVSSEYRNGSDMTASGVPVRIVNWSTADLVNRITTASATPVTATRLATTNFEGVQGVMERPNATSGRPEFFVSRTVPGNDSSQLWYEHDGDGVCPANGVYVDNAEQISYWVDSDGNGHLWTFTEYANRRMLVRIYTNEYNDPPSGCPTQ
ncbi:MAG TPA: hypothetical protein VL738_23395 [Dactylosporangium sp.]|jgi:hypothetical protein|nr:hypothetical protein [Dactylosporangium sp.]